MIPESQSSNFVLMVRPVVFGYNEETSSDNVFQSNINVDPERIQNSALEEFDNLVALIRKNGIHVIVVEDTLQPETPDSIFPNNWFTTHSDGRIGLYPLKAKNRRAERREDIIELLIENGCKITHIEDFRDAELNEQYLEGTGSMILDRKKQLCYVSVSERSNPLVVAEFCEVFGYQPVFFQSIVNEKPAYHTNVVLSIASNFALVASSTISRVDEKEKLINALKISGKEIIHLTEKQVLEFAGNGLELTNLKGDTFFVISSRGYSALSKSQIKIIKKHATLLRSNLETIETYGGGSARCMIAEVFLPYQRK